MGTLNSRASRSSWRKSGNAPICRRLLMMRRGALAVLIEVGVESRFANLMDVPPDIGSRAIYVSEAVFTGELTRGDRALVPAVPLGISGKRGDGAAVIPG